MNEMNFVRSNQSLLLFYRTRTCLCCCWREKKAFVYYWAETGQLQLLTLILDCRLAFSHAGRIRVDSSRLRFILSSHTSKLKRHRVRVKSYEFICINHTSTHMQMWPGEINHHMQFDPSENSGSNPMWGTLTKMHASCVFVDLYLESVK